MNSNLQLPFNVKKQWVNRGLIMLAICWMSVYPIYTSYYKANAIEQYQRHKDFLVGVSLFHNPWQYRVLCPIVIEGTYQVMDHTIFKVFEVKGINLGLPGDVGGKNEVTQKLIHHLKNPEFIKYTIVFLGFRFALQVTLLLLLYHFLSLFVSSVSLKWIGLIMSSLFMGNGVVDSDMTFNTYLDIIVYLWAGIVIVKNYSPWWIVLITVVGVLNRETSILVPVLYFMAQINWNAWPSFRKILPNDWKPYAIAAISGVMFVALFIVIRWYQGYQPQSSWRVEAGWPMLKLNLFSSVSIKTYMELFGIFAIFPLWTFFVIRDSNRYLKIFFWTLVPVWFGIHFVAAIAYQTRLFLVPTLLVLLPGVLEYIEREITNRVIPVEIK